MAEFPMPSKSFESTRSHGRYRDAVGPGEIAQNEFQRTWAHVSGWAQLSANFRRVSCVIACHGATRSAVKLLPTLSDVLTEIGFPWEISLVDKAGADSHSALSPWLDIPGFRWVRPESSASAAAATWTGMCDARGDAVVLINADANPPVERLPELIEAWEDGNLIAILGRDTAVRGLDLEGSSSELRGAQARTLPLASFIYGSSNMLVLDRSIVNALALQPPN